MRALAEDPATAPLAAAALTVSGGADVLVVGDHPVIVNWGLMPGGKGANALSRPTHYAATLGRFLPMSGPAPEPVAAPRATPVAAPVAEPAPGSCIASPRSHGCRCWCCCCWPPARWPGC
ncbi:hypothetical protein ACFSZS_11130 [Seohaeicola zhoushanensis]